MEKRKREGDKKGKTKGNLNQWHGIHENLQYKIEKGHLVIAIITENFS